MTVIVNKGADSLRIDGLEAFVAPQLGQIAIFNNSERELKGTVEMVETFYIKEFRYEPNYAVYLSDE